VTFSPGGGKKNSALLLRKRGEKKERTFHLVPSHSRDREKKKGRKEDVGAPRGAGTLAAYIMMHLFAVLEGRGGKRKEGKEGGEVREKLSSPIWSSIPSPKCRPFSNF